MIENFLIGTTEFEFADVPMGIVYGKLLFTDLKLLIHFDKEILEFVVATNAKKRFSFNDSLDKIRANQGHSVEVDLGFTNQMPPKVLYHGTAEKSVASIFENGIEKRSRQHVHLSRDIETALKVGQRHGKPVILEVNTQAMYNDSFVFYISENGVWLTDNVPAKYIKLTSL